MIYFLTLSFAGGVLLATLVTPSTPSLLFVSSIVLGLLLYGLLLRIQKRNTRIVGIALLAILFCICGMVRMQSVAQVPQEYLQALNNTSVSVVGSVAQFPEDRETKKRIVLGDVSINEIAKEKVDILVWLPKSTDVRVKDRVSLQGVVRIPESFQTDTGRVFDYTSYLSKDNIYLEMSDPQEIDIVSFEGLSLFQGLEATKRVFLSRIEHVLPEPHSSLAGGILLGEKQSLGDFWQERFREVGLTHIVVLSGYNIAIVVVVILFLLSGLSLLWGSIFGLFGIILFALLVGGGATVVRASIMASLLIIARYFHRPYDAVRGLALAGFFMIALNPRILIHDLSFQLSFLATLGIILFTPIAERMFQRVPKRLGLQEIVVTTFSAQLFVFPWIAYTIGDFSVVSFVANILVLPAIPLAMLFSFVAGVLPQVVIAFPAYVLLEYVLFVTETLAKIPFASVAVPQVPFWMVAFLYGVLLYVVFFFRNKNYTE